MFWALVRFGFHFKHEIRDTFILPQHFRDGYQQSVLHLGAQYLDKGHIERLVNGGCEVDATDEKGFTPFFYAVMADNTTNMKVMGEREI